MVNASNESTIVPARPFHHVDAVGRLSSLRLELQTLEVLRVIP